MGKKEPRQGHDMGTMGHSLSIDLESGTTGSTIPHTVIMSRTETFVKCRLGRCLSLGLGVPVLRF